MAEKKKFRAVDFLMLLSLTCLTITLLSVFLPLARMQIPMLGARNISAFSTISEVLSSKRSDQTTITLADAQNAVTSGQNKDIFREKPVYRFIPIGMMLGVVAHVLLIVLLAGFLLRNLWISLIAAGAAFVSSLGFMFGLILMDDAVRYAAQASMKELEGNPFAGLAEVFVGGIKIEPATAAYLLLGGTFLIFVFKWIEKNYDLD